MTIPIRGINRAESDDTVSDGACEDVYNLSYRAGTFETACAPRLLHPVADWAGWSVSIRLDDMPGEEYVARRGDELWRVRLAAGRVSPRDKILDFPTGAEDVRYFGFGRMLYVNYALAGELQELCFRYRNNTFERVDFAAVTPPAIQVSYDIKSAAKEEFAPNPERDYSAVKIAHIERYEDNPASNKEEFFYNVGVGALNEEGYIFGTAYIFAAYKLFDGSIVKPGALEVVSGDRGTFVGSPYLYRYSKRSGVFDYYGRVQGVRPTVSVVVPPEAADNDLIRSVVLLSTRNEPTWEYEKVHEKYGTGGYPAVSQGYGVYDCSHGCIWNEALDEPQNTFYEVAELDFRAGENSVLLTWAEHYEHIVNNPLYEANFSIHETRSGGKYEYNNRLHIFDLRTRLHVPPTDSVFMDGYVTEKRIESPDIRCGVDYTLTVDGRTVVVRTTFPGHYWERERTQAAKPNPDSPAPEEPDPDPIVVRTRLWYIRSLYAYPDSRAEKADIWVQEAGRTIAHKSVPLISSPGANLSFRQLQIEYDSNNKVTTWTQRNTIPERLELAEDPDSDYVPAPDAETNSVLCEPNKIQVSRSSNPFVYDPAHIYTIGGSGERIRQIIATAERMTEAVYGYQPLLVFTDRTVYALESGEGEVLYARTIPILSRTIVEGTNAVEGDGAVFFVSTSGVTAIVRGQISSVSDAMKRWAGLQPVDTELADFDDYVRAARLMFNRKASELILYNPTAEYAYVYSLTGQYWTRRSWDGAVEPYFNELATGAGIASLSEEDPARPVAECRLVTRPLKLGSLEYKRIETLAARMRCGGAGSFELSVEGSDDAIRWFPLRSEQSRSVIRRTPSSFRYHRLRLTGSGGDFLTITHFDVEFYNRFVHRLR